MRQDPLTQDRSEPSAGQRLAKLDFSRRMHGAMGPAILAVVTFFLFWPFARLDFDRHHDGYMLAQAIAVHHGATVHADVFAQYGPVTPWVQSVALFLPIGPGLVLRTLNVAFIVITVFLLADMGRKSPRSWPVTRAAGWAAAVAWIVLADVWLGIAMLPWSSTLAAMLSVATLYLFMRSLRHAEDGFIRAASAAGLTGGVCLGLMPFTRINVGLSAMAVCLFVVLLIVIPEPGVYRAPAGLFALGAFLTVLTVIAILAATNALTDFYYQAIQWPLTWGRDASGALKTQSFLVGSFAYQALPVTLVCGALYLQLRAGTVQRGWSVTRSGATVFTILVGTIIVVWENLGELISTSVRTSRRSWVEGFVSLISPNAQYLYFFLMLSAVASLLTCLIFAYKYLSGDKASRGLTPWLLLAGLALSGLTQIVPTSDPRHVWWAAPVGLLLLFSAVQVTSGLNRLSFNPLALPLIAAALMAIFSASTYLGVERVQGQPGTIIEGMLVSKDTFSQITQDAVFLREQLHGSESAVYLTNDGDLSVLDGTYRSADSYFVEWGGAPRIKTRIRLGNPIVVQTSAFGEGNINKLAASIKYEVIARSPRLVVLMPANSTSGGNGPR